MSVRAHRAEVTTEQEATFNLWHYPDLVQFLGMEGEGIEEVEVAKLKEALTEISLDDDTAEAIKRDVEWAESLGEEYLTYNSY